MSVRAGLARRSVGAWGLWFFAVSASAPLTGLVGGVVTTYGATTVVGVGLAFLVLTVALALLTVGYVGMARYVGHAAPFYALLARGLGRPWGVAGAAVALVGYNLVEIALFGLIGDFLAGVFGGVWWAWAAVVWVAIFVFGLLRVDIGAGVVAVLLVLEIGVIVLFVVAGFTSPAGGAVSFEPLQPSLLLVNGVGGVFALSAAAFMGYESGTAYGEEARTDRSVGRATFAALLFMGPSLAVGSWALALAAGPDQVVAKAQQDPALPLTVISTSYGVLGPLIAGLGSVLLITSIFGSMLSFHGTVSRYLFALGRERVLASWLARTGTGAASRRDAPVSGSVVQSVIAAVVVATFAVVGADPVTVMFTWLAAVAAVALLTLLVATSGAALRWFYNGGGTSEGPWTRIVAPVLGLVVGVLVVGSTVYNLGALLGVDPGSAMPLIVPAVVGLAAACGLIWAGVLYSGRPDVYRGIGQGRPHPLALPDQRLSDVRL
ncbi:APC family permease [Actinomycetes bacterium KLBMP 9797]